MATLGTKKFWKPSIGGSAPQQILKMSGYINVLLQAVHYFSKGNSWQTIFGGSDKITLTSRIVYRYGSSTIECAAIQDVTTVDSNSVQALGTGRNVALKVPADADGLELRVDISAVEEDNFETALSLLNSPEYQKPLEVAPQVVGEIFTITSMVKRLFADVNPSRRLEVSYPGIISEGMIANPVESNRLVTGHLILISNQDDEDRILDRAIVADLAVEGNTLKFKGKEVKSTYIIYNISMDTYRGHNTKATWFLKFQESVTKLNDLILTTDDDERKNIYQNSLKHWIEAGALLQDDPTYLQNEKDRIKQDYLDQLITKFNKVYRPMEVAAGTSTIFGMPMEMGRNFNEVTVAYHVPRDLAQLIEFKDMRLDELQRSARTYRDMVRRLN